MGLRGRPAFIVSLICGAIGLLGAIGMAGVKMLCAAVLSINHVPQSSESFSLNAAYVGTTIDKYTYILFLAGAVLMSLALLVNDQRKVKDADEG
jgi:hypothetical protein